MTCHWCNGRYLADWLTLRPHNCAADPTRAYDWHKPHGHEYLSPDVSGWDANGAPV